MGIGAGLAWYYSRKVVRIPTEVFYETMAVLKVMPEQAIVDGFKGKIDFYLYKGIPVARKWPVWTRREPYPAERANQDDFRYCNQLYHTLQHFIQLQYQRMAQGTRLTAKDWFVKAYMKGIQF